MIMGRIIAYRADLRVAVGKSLAELCAFCTRYGVGRKQDIAVVIATEAERASAACND